MLARTYCSALLPLACHQPRAALDLHCPLTEAFCVVSFYDFSFSPLMYRECSQSITR